MRYAYLTIDDIPTRNTPKIIDYLNTKGIQPVMFCWGQRLEANEAEAIYALRHGAILQNHTYSHPFASKLSFDEEVAEITRNEVLIANVYRKAGVERPFKLFRFPYGDQGGDKREKLQMWLTENGFDHIDDRAFDDDAYTKNGCPSDQQKNRDVLWTFDFAEYNLRPGNNFTFDDVMLRVEKAFPIKDSGELSVPANGAAPDNVRATDIVLIHDHEETESEKPGYFKAQIDAILARGVRFVTPRVQ